jgi:tRNA nucleotidyltransferase (CCA-adding enzyme)
MVGNSQRMSADPQIDPSALGERLDALPGIAELRAAAGAAPAYLVGGAVRDLLRGEARSDLDIVVESDFGPIAEALGGELVEHERFQTANVLVGELDVDIGRARTETYAHPGALPDVAPATIADDLARRDFTVNAMAVPLAGEPELIDPHGGLDDLRAGLLRVLHPGSFADDPTRALRAARYVARLGFELEPETARQLRAADLETVSEDRIIGELGKIAIEEQPSRALALIADWGLLDLGTAPKLAAALERLFEADPIWAEFADRDTAILLAIAPAERARSLRGRAARLSHHKTPGSPAQIHVLAHDHSAEVLAIARAAGARWLDDFAERLRHVDLEITGYDLIEAGVPEGPAIGRALNAALAAKLDGTVTDRDGEFRVALAAAEGPGGATD